MLALLDGDLFAYRCAASAENDSAEVAIWRCRDSIELCLEQTAADSYQVWLSDRKENNFRYAIYPEYKANRTRPAPRYLPDVLEYLTKNWDANIAVNQEADDALGIEQCKSYYSDEPYELNTIVCSIDKDLLQIPGRHFNFVKGELSEITPLDGIRHFYKQLLIGDTADNVRGVDGVGKVKAGRYIDPLSDPVSMYNICLDLYGGDVSRLHMNAQVLWIRQQPEQIWTPPNAEVQD